MLDNAAPYYQAGLGNRLCYELAFNDYNGVTKSGVSSPKVPDAKYKITDISLEYEIVTQPDLARSIRSQYHPYKKSLEIPWKSLDFSWKIPRNPRNPRIFKSLEKEQKFKDFLDIFQEIQENLDFMKV